MKCSAGQSFNFSAPETVFKTKIELISIWFQLKPWAENFKKIYRYDKVFCFYILRGPIAQLWLLLWHKNEPAWTAIAKNGTSYSYTQSIIMFNSISQHRRPNPTLMDTSFPKHRMGTKLRTDIFNSKSSHRLNHRSIVSEASRMMVGWVTGIIKNVSHPRRLRGIQEAPEPQLQQQSIQ